MTELVPCKTLELDKLALDVYQTTSADEGLMASLLREIETLWPVFERIIQNEDIPQALGLKVQEGAQAWEAELTFCDNNEIQALNAQYRGKDQATDVLSFCVFADQPGQTRQVMAQLPVVSLGSIFVSLPWAKTEAAKSGDHLQRYILERVFHGFLHLLGVHHDTMPDFERVKRIQQETLASFEKKGTGV